MLPSEYKKLSDADKRKVRQGIAQQGKNVASPRKIIESLNRLRDPKVVNSTYNAKVIDYYIDDTNFPKLVISSEILSSTGGNKWIQDLVFMSPELFLEPANDRLGIRARAKSGRILKDEIWYVKTMSVDTPVKVRCSCPDFRHTFSWEDADINSLKGRRIKYISTGKRPPRNPESIPGVCKHLGSLINVIQRSTNLLSKSPSLRPQNLYK